MVKKDTMLRFWCQKVLPLVYDDSLSYYELLNKVVLHLNQHTEDINALIDFYNTFAEDVEDIIRQMMDDGDFNEIVADTIGSLIAEEYDPTKSYIIFDYCIYESKLYRANGSTTGDFDPEKWVERTVGYDLTTIQNYIYSLNAGNVSFDGSATYAAGTVGKEIKDIKANLNDIDAEEVSFNSSETYSSGTVGKELGNLNDAISRIVPDKVGTLSEFLTAAQNSPDSKPCLITSQGALTLLLTGNAYTATSYVIASAPEGTNRVDYTLFIPAFGVTVTGYIDITSQTITVTSSTRLNSFYSSTSVWAGNTLTFSLEAVNKQMYHFVALRSAVSYPDIEEAYLIIRSDGLVLNKLHGTATYSYTDGVLTITLPTNTYWGYKLESIGNYN